MTSPNVTAEDPLVAGAGVNPSTSASANVGSSSAVNEPMVFHGHTLTTKVPLRQVCQAIMKYGFIASPYPIIISAENHCSIAGQEMIARIMVEEFGSALVRYPIDGPDLPTQSQSQSQMNADGSEDDGVLVREGNWKGKGKITQLPSPEGLKGRILLKTKNLMLGKADPVAGGSVSVTSSESDLEPSSSASESEVGMLSRGLYGLERERKGGKKRSGEGGGDIVRGAYTNFLCVLCADSRWLEGLIKASSMIQRVRSVGRSPGPSIPPPSSSTATPSTPSGQLTQQPLVSSPGPLSPPLPLATGMPLTVPMPVPIPIPRGRSSTSAAPPSSYPYTGSYVQPSSVPSISSIGTSSSPKKPSSINFEGGVGMTSSSYTGSTSILSSSLGQSQNQGAQPSSISSTGGGGPLALVRRKSSQVKSPIQRPKPKMSMALVALLVYTVGVKCRGFRRSGHLYLHSADETGSASDVKSTKSIKSNKSKSKDGKRSLDGGSGGGVVVEGEEELYAPEHMFSLSENSANKMLRTCMMDLIRHTEGHLVRVYPRGTRMRSTNFEPHRYWSAGAQLVAINWQTFGALRFLVRFLWFLGLTCWLFCGLDLGYIINHAMFQRNARCGYVLKPPPLRYPSKPEYTPEKWRKRPHTLNVTIISAQQLPRVKVKDGSGHEVLGLDKDKDGYEEGREGKDKSVTVDPYVEVTLHVPEWTYCVSPALPASSSAHAAIAATNSSTPTATDTNRPQPQEPLRFTTSQPKTLTHRTQIVKNNGFNPIWNEAIRIPFDCIALPGMLELIFVRFVVKQEGQKDDAEPLAVCCVSLGEMQQGYRHLPLYDATLSQYLFSTLFVKINVSS